MSCGKFVFPSHYLPLPILDIPSPVVNSSSHLITCPFPPWKSHVMWQIRLPISLPATSHLGRPISCGKFVFPSHYPPIPILDVPSPVVSSSSLLITCHFPSWTSHLLWQIRLPISLPATSHLGRPISCGKFVFPPHYLPLPTLEVPCNVANSSSHLIACHFPYIIQYIHIYICIFYNTHTYIYIL